jgi:hypothetical protein
MPTRGHHADYRRSFIAEGAPLVRQAAFTPITIGLKKMAVISSYTREVAEHSNPQIEGILRSTPRSTSIAIDTILLDAAASAIRPAGLRNGVPATADGGFRGTRGRHQADDQRPGRSQ